MAGLRGRSVVFVLAGEVLGGAERGALDLADVFRDEGASVSVLALIASPNLPNVVTGLTWRATGTRTVWRQCDVNGTTRFSSRVFRHALHATAANRAAVQGRSDPETAWARLISEALEPRRS